MTGCSHGPMIAAGIFAGLVVVSSLAQMASTGAKERLGLPLPPGKKAPLVDFRDVAAVAGLKAVIVSGDTSQKYLVEGTGTGVALFDYDNDGLLDIFLVNADHIKPLSPPPTVHLYHNLGGLRFEDVTEKAGLGHTGWGQGVCAGDFDNDGYVDLFIGQWGHNVLLHNQGNGKFRDETKERGLYGPSRWSTGCAFLDYDRDGHLDLVVANYVDFQPGEVKSGDPEPCEWKGVAVPCGPRGLKGETVLLYRNDGKGHFTDVSKRAGVDVPRQYYGFTVLTGDFDNDGWTDFYVTCDSTPSLLFRNKQDGTFEEIGVAAGVAFNEDGREQAGMGATTADYDGDGYLDIFKTNFSSDTSTLYRNTRDSGFLDVTAGAGLAVHTRDVKWGAGFVDVDQDGWKDLFVAAGHIYPFVDKTGVGETFRQVRELYWNRGDGKFFDLSDASGAGIAARHSSRGIAIGDLDNDGAMEIVVVNLFEPPSLLKNFGAKGNSLLIRAVTASGRDAIGARVTVTAGGRKQIDEVRSGGYHISQGDFRVHFGLAKAEKADLAVEWLGGKTEKFAGVGANQLVVIRQGNGIVERRAVRGK